MVWMRRYIERLMPGFPPILNGVCSFGDSEDCGKSKLERWIQELDFILQVSSIVG